MYNPYDRTGPPPPPPVQRPPRRIWPIVALLIGFLFLCVFVSSPDARQGFMEGLKPMIDAQNNVRQSETATASAATASALAVPAPQWTITHTFAGTGNSQTTTFAVNGEWQLNWYCSLSVGGTGQYHLSIDIDRPGQKTPLVPYAVDAFCSSTSATSGSVEEQQTGTLYFAVTADTQWTVDVEQLV